MRVFEFVKTEFLRGFTPEEEPPGAEEEEDASDDELASTENASPADASHIENQLREYREVWTSGALPISQILAVARQRRGFADYVDEFTSEVKRTLFVTGLHRDVGWRQISQFFAREVRAVKFYAEEAKDGETEASSTLCALVEFHSSDLPIQRFRTKLEEDFGSDITVKQAKVCIRQALGIETEVMARRARLAEQRLAEIEEQLRQSILDRFQLSSSLQEIAVAKTNLELKTDKLTEENSRCQEKLMQRKWESEMLSRAFNSTKAKLSACTEAFSPSTSPYSSLSSFSSSSSSSSSSMMIPHGARPSYHHRPTPREILADMEALEAEINEEKMQKKAFKEAQRFALERESKSFALALMAAQHWREWAMAKAKRRQEEELTRQFLETEMKLKQQAIDEKEYSCPICCTDYPIEEMYTLDKCYHRFCFECLGRFVLVKVQEGQTQNMKCPDPDCKEFMTPAEVRHVVDEETYSKYEEFTLASALNAMPDIRWCPKPDCKNAMIGGEENLMMVCSNSECRFSFCYKCKEEWHADATCEQYQQWRRENSEADAKYDEWVKANAKMCPNCQAPIEKNGGCNHMTCKNCKYEFCWLCNAQYNKNHFGKMPWNCRQFS